MHGKIQVKLVLLISFVLWRAEAAGVRVSNTYILYPTGTKLDAINATPSMMIHEMIQTVQNRFHIAGHSLKKCDSSTSLMVDAHCML